jgi:thiamine transport system substrate-binding protein
MEGKRSRADILLGVDEILAARAKDLGLFSRLGEKTFANLETDLPRGREFAPFDFGYLSLVYDAARTKVKAGLSLSDFASEPAFRKKLALEDPRTSSIGLAFLAWTHALYREKTDAFWLRLAPQVLNVAPGWSGAYGLFLQNEAAFALSYTTSPAYERAHSSGKNLQALVFPEGNYRQVEEAGVLKTSKQAQAAEQWLQCLLSEEVQKQLPETQWMYPARAGIKLPSSFSAVPKVKATINSEPEIVAREMKDWLAHWTSAMVKAQ